MTLANDLRKGMAIKYNSNVAIVLEVSHRTPGNLRAFVQVIIRYIGTGKSADVRFSSTEKVELVDVQRIKYDFSYEDHGEFYFMDAETFETITLQSDIIADAKNFLTENLQVEVLYVAGKAVSLEIPASVNLRIKEAAEGLRGDSSNNVMKSAVLETGKSIQVPLFIREGELIKVDTRTGEYMGRA